MQGVLFIVCGPSGVGKTSLGAELREHHPDLVLSVSYTTRDPRPGEVDGDDYHFVDAQTFERMRTEGAFAEWAEVHGNYYGTARDQIERAWAQGQDVFFDIDYQGARQLQEAYPEQTVRVMVLPPDMDTLERRLRGEAPTMRRSSPGASSCARRAGASTRSSSTSSSTTASSWALGELAATMSMRRPATRSPGGRREALLGSRRAHVRGLLEPPEASSRASPSNAQEE